MNATTPINATPTNRIISMGNSPNVESDGSKPSSEYHYDHVSAFRPVLLFTGSGIPSWCWLRYPASFDRKYSYYHYMGMNKTMQGASSLCQTWAILHSQLLLGQFSDNRLNTSGEAIVLKLLYTSP
jgi:hypothetical protein